MTPMRIRDNFYVVPNLPHNFILSRSILRKLGYTLEQKQDQVFEHKATDEVLEGQNEEVIMENMDEFKHENENENFGKQKNVKEEKSFLNKFRKTHNVELDIGEILLDAKTSELVSESDSNVAKDNEHKNKNENRNMKIKVGKETNVIKIGKSKNIMIQQAIEELIRRNQKLIANTSFDIGKLKLKLKEMEMKIELKEDFKEKAIKNRPYPLNQAHQEEVKRQVRELEKAGIIRKSSSQFAAPVVLVKKKGGSLRMCVDYRKLNQATIRDEWPLPNIGEVIETIRGKCVFSKLDIRAGYLHVPIREKDKHKTAFIAPNGLYEWNRMGFGFTNAPATFQRIMTSMFDDLEDVEIYIDDLLIASETEEEHLQTLQQVFQRFEQHNLKLAIDKCEFLQEQLVFLGQVISI